MPLYEYQCSSCKKVVEVIQKFSDAPLKDCPECRQTGTLGKLISQTSFQLKGTGWYNTDYRKPKTSAADSKIESKPASEPAPVAKPAETSNVKTNAKTPA